MTKLEATCNLDDATHAINFACCTLDDIADADIGLTPEAIAALRHIAGALNVFAMTVTHIADNLNPEAKEGTNE